MKHRDLAVRLLVTISALFVLTATAAHGFAQDPSGRPEPTKKRPARKPAGKSDPVVPTVILTVLTEPPLSAVYINGERRGATNSEGRIQFEKLPVGHYSVEVKKEGFHPMLRAFEAGSESPTLVFKLEPNLEDILKEFDGLMAAGKLTGPNTPNAMELIDRLSTKYPGRPEADRLRGVLAAKFSETVKPVIAHTVSDWRTVTRNELVQALDGAMNASVVRKDETRFQAEAAYLRGVLALHDWQTGGRVKGATGGDGGDLLANARAELEKSITLDDSFAAARLQQASVSLALGDAAAAEAAFVKVTQIEPQWMQARLGLGATYYSQAKWEKAIDAYKRAAEIDPKSAAALSGIGLARVGKGEKDGLKDLERAVQLDPSSAVAHFNLGMTYAQAKDKKQVAKAEGELKTAIQLNPNNSEFANSIAEQRITDLASKKKKK
jgi:tetratricopeptide (TPR) repeat protein